MFKHSHVARIGHRLIFLCSNVLRCPTGREPDQDISLGAKGSAGQLRHTDTFPSGGWVPLAWQEACADHWFYVHSP